MASGRSLIFLFTILAIISTILAREGRGESEHSGSGDRPPHREGGPPSSHEKNSNERERPNHGRGNPHSHSEESQEREDTSNENQHELTTAASNQEEGSSNEKAFGFQLPSFGGSSNLGSMTLPDFTSLFSGLLSGSQTSGSGDSSGSQIPSFGSLFGGSRNERNEPFMDDENSVENNENGVQSRFFFSSLFGRYTTCNYNTQAGARCTACRQVLRCYPNNVGRLVTCRGLFRYCNNGRCSLFPGSACSAATTATSATSATSAATSGTTATPSG